MNQKGRSLAKNMRETFALLILIHIHIMEYLKPTITDPDTGATIYPQKMNSRTPSWSHNFE